MYLGAKISVVLKVYRTSEIVKLIDGILVDAVLCEARHVQLYVKEAGN